MRTFQFFGLMSIILMAFSAHATSPIAQIMNQEKSCQNFVKADNDYVFFGFGPYKKGFEDIRVPTYGHVRVVSQNQPDMKFDLDTHDAAIDAVTYQGHLFVLTFSNLQEWDLTSHALIATYPTYAINRTLKYYEHARAMVVYNDQLIIAHGRLGASVFNLRTRHLHNQFRLVKSQLPLESAAMGVTLQGNRAIFALDNFTPTAKGTKPAFRGFVVYDLSLEQVVSELDGVDPGLTTLWSDANILVASYGGFPLWKYTLNAVTTSQTLPSQHVEIKKFPVNGHPIGHGFMDGESVYTCYLKAPPQAGGTYTQVPMIITRKDIGLN